MAQDKMARTSTPGAASTVALEDLAESIARGTLRALEERQLGPDGGKVNLRFGDGTTVLGILIPPWRKCPPGEIEWEWGCRPVVLGIIIQRPLKPGDLDEVPDTNVGG